MRVSRRPKARSQKALETDARVLRGALSALTAEGPDKLRLTNAAAHAGLTHGATYARYDNSQELLVDVWEQSLRAEITTLCHAIHALRADPADPLLAEAVFGTPTPNRLGAIGVLIASARIVELTEVIPRDNPAAIGADILGDDPLEVGLLALALGAAIYAPYDGPLHPDHTGFLNRLPATTTRTPGRRPNLVVPGEIRFDTGDLLLDKLYQATADVFARSGVAGITLRRISRLSGYGPTAIYTCYDSLDDFVIDVINLATHSAQTPAYLVARYATPHGFAAHFDWTHPTAWARRRATLEVHLAALYQPDILNALAGSDVQTLTTAAPAVFPDLTPTDALQQLLILRNAAVGRMLLADLNLHAHLDWRPLAHLLLRE